jgi:hypothetical protein
VVCLNGVLFPSLQHHLTLKAMDKKLYTPDEVMKMFNVTRPTFTDWTKKGVFQKISIPGQRRVYVTAESVEKIINKGK